MTVRTVRSSATPLESLEGMLASAIERASDGDAILYLGYPLVLVNDVPRPLDGLIVSSRGVVGIVAEDLGSSTDDICEEIEVQLAQQLLTAKSLRNGSRLKIEPRVVRLAASATGLKPSREVSQDTFEAFLLNLPEIPPDLVRAAQSAVENITGLRSARSRARRGGGHHAAILAEIDRHTATFDEYQQRAAIQAREGPQRIRGLAGSGKTIVLAWKAAYLHVTQPELTIALTFHTRSLYQQLLELVTGFCTRMGFTPNYDKLRVLHSWGSQSRPGVYSEISRLSGTRPMTFSEARSAFPEGREFEGACSRLLPHADAIEESQKFDAVLVDEAQDLPQHFFELLYRASVEPHRITWAYDELQNLGEYAMRPPSVLFGRDGEGNPRVRDDDFERDDSNADIILPRCYRNTPWALTVAHALGFGIYRAGSPGFVQMFDDPSLWEDVGYQRLEGELRPGSRVVLARSTDSAPKYFAEVFPDARDAVCTRVFESAQEQFAAAAKEIKELVTSKGLDLRDVLVIVCDPATMRSQGQAIAGALRAVGLDSHLVGITSSVDAMFEDNSVAISSIFRAKGNEAPYVFVLNADYGESRFSPARKRSILFTAITRSRAWVRIYGVGDGMRAIESEVNKVVTMGYKLDFTVPTLEQLERIRKLHQDMPPEEERSFLEKEVTVAEALRLLKGLDSSKLSPEIKDALRSATQAFEDDDSI